MSGKTETLRYIDAINAAFKEEMRRDKNVVLIGQDLISMSGAPRETSGIFNEFGPERILETPITEQAIVGMAYGCGMTGLRPVAFLFVASFIMCAGDQIFLKMGASRQEWGWRGPLPVVLYSGIMGGIGIGQDHALNPESILAHSPGLKVVMPSTAYDAKGLLKTAIRDDEPVVFLAHRGLFGKREAIPTKEYLIPLGKADIKKVGTDVTIVTYSAMVHKALAAADELVKEGISVEIVDLRSIVPMDIKAIVQSARKTGRLLIVHEAMKRSGMAGEIAFRFMEAAPETMKTLKAPIKRLAAKNVALPRSQQVEPFLVPQIKDIVDAVKEMV